MNYFFEKLSMGPGWYGWVLFEKKNFNFFSALECSRILESDFFRGFPGNPKHVFCPEFYADHDALYDLVLQRAARGEITWLRWFWGEKSEMIFQIIECRWFIHHSNRLDELSRMIYKLWPVRGHQGSNLGQSPEIRVKLGKVVKITNNPDMLYIIRTGLMSWVEWYINHDLSGVIRGQTWVKTLK